MLAECEFYLSATVKYFTHVISDPLFFSASLVHFLFCAVGFDLLAALTHVSMMGVWGFMYSITSALVYYPDERTQKWKCEEAGEILLYYSASFFVDPILLIGSMALLVGCIFGVILWV